MAILSKSITQAFTSLSILDFRPHIPLQIETDSFTVKTADTLSELLSVFRFRYKSFAREYMSKGLSLGLDFDYFDSLCDHLIIKDKKTDKIVGCFRLICSEFASSFYSQNEFDWAVIKNLEGVKLELGRATVDNAYRRGVIITLLWRGIAEYIRLSGARYLLGCSSYQSLDPVQVKKMDAYLQKIGVLTNEFGVKVRSGYQWTSDELKLADAESLKWTEEDIDAAKTEVPPLLGFYIKAGAKVCGSPAVDRPYNCVDYLTLLEVSQLNSTLSKKYGLTQQA